MDLHLFSSSRVAQSRSGAAIWTLVSSVLFSDSKQEQETGVTANRHKEHNIHLIRGRLEEIQGISWKCCLSGHAPAMGRSRGRGRLCVWGAGPGQLVTGKGSRAIRNTCKHPKRQRSPQLATPHPSSLRYFVIQWQLVFPEHLCSPIVLFIVQTIFY